MQTVCANLSCIDGAVFGTGHDESVAGDEETIGEGLALDGLVSGNNVGDDLHLGGGELQDAKKTVSTM